MKQKQPFDEIQAPDWEIQPIEGPSRAEQEYDSAIRKKRLNEIAERKRQEEHKQPMQINLFFALAVVVLALYIVLRFNDLDISCTRIESGVSCVVVDRPFDGEYIEPMAPTKPQRPKWDF